MKVNGATSSRSSLKTTISDPSKPLQRRDSAKRSVQWSEDGEGEGKLTQVLLITPIKNPSQDSIAPASSPPPLDLSGELPRVRNRLGWLGSLLPNCLYDLICLIFCLSDSPSRSEEVVEIEGELLAASSVLPAANLPIEPPLVHLERWFEKMSEDLKRSDSTRVARVVKTYKRGSFDGCQSLLIVKVHFPKADPVFFTHKKFYDVERYDAFPAEILEFYRSNLSTLQEMTGYEALFITIHPNFLMPSLTNVNVDSSTVSAADGILNNKFTSSGDDEELKNPKRILKKFPLLQEGNVSVADLTPPKA